MAFLCISLNNSSMNAVHLMDGELSDIDKYTVKFDTAKEILQEYPEKIAEFKHIYDIDKNSDIDIKLRLFLPDDKERFVMYKKHLIAFRSIIKNRHFLKYAITYETNLLDKKYRDLINDEKATNSEIYHTLNDLIKTFDKNAYYGFIRRICYQYNDYAEDYPKQKIPTIDTLYREYLMKNKGNQSVDDNVKQSSLTDVSIVENKSISNPFAVFEHPNFAKKYGNTIDNKKPIFILGGVINNQTRKEYIELYENCKKCFNNPIYYPFNANVSLPLTKEFASIYGNALLVIVNGNDYNKDLIDKINYASYKGITVLILINDEYLEQLYNNQFQNYDTIIVRHYQYGSYKSSKMFADIMAGLYINAYKMQKRQVA